MQVMGQRLQVTEQRQQQMMSFLAKAMQNPTFLAQLVHQNEAKKRLAATRKKRRLPKQETDEDSAELGTQQDGQIVKYEPSYDPSSNDARSMFMQLFASNDGGTVDVNNHLEALLRDLGSPEEEMPESRQSGVTLTEMQVPSAGQEAMVNLTATDFATEPLQYVSPASPLSPQTATNHVVGMGSSEVEVASYEDNADAVLRLREPNEDPMTLELAGMDATDAETSTADSAAANSAVNDIFWEQFLSGSAAESPGTEQEVDDIPDSIDHVDMPVGDSWLYSKPSVDQLAEQMGQLAPGSKP